MQGKQILSQQEDAMPKGYNGKILRVDLTAGRIWEETPEERVYRLYMGGSALALYYLLRELKPGTDPLSPENLLVFTSSVLSGAPVAGVPRYTVAARSPLTGLLGRPRRGILGA